MGKFDGFLICTDIDGTFASGENIAVEYFKANGGKFTFATGRGVNHMRNPELRNVFNAPVCLCNGGIIYDYKSERILRERRLDLTVKEAIEAVNEQKDTVDIIDVYYDYTEETLRVSDVSEIPPELLDVKAIKIIFVFENAEKADKFKSFALKQESLKSCYISKSWSVGVEFNSADATKGKALDFIKNYLGNIHTAIGIGDYENDITLLTHADIGVAVGDALDVVKQAADMIVKPVREFAVKDLIERLDREL